MARISMKEVTFEELPNVEASDLNIGDRFIEGHQAIWNPDTGHVFCIPTAEYKLVSHQDMITKTRKLIKAAPGLGDYETKICIDGEGERMRTTFTFSQAPVKFNNGGREEIINPTVELLNSYDRSWKNTLMVGAQRLVCTNGMTIGESWGKFKKRHIRSLEFEEAQQVLEGGLEKVEQAAIEWKNWGSEQMETKAVEQVLDKMDLSNKERQLLTEEEEVSTQLSIEDWLLFQELEMRPDRVKLMTRWVFYNAITQFITHQVGSELRRLQLQNRVTDLFYN